jgi:sugar lactone lactonase YvrE
MVARLTVEMLEGRALLSYLYVGEDFGRIDRFDTSTGLVSPPTFAAPPFTTRGLAVDAAGDLFATDVTNNRIVEYTSGGVMSVFSTSPLLSNPHGLAFDSAGNLYVANAGKDNILKFAPSGVGSVFNSQSTGDVPVGLTFDAAGNLFVSDQQSNKIVRITPAGVASNFATTGVLGPAGMAFDKAGNLFVSAESSFSIVKYAPNGSFSTFANVPGISAGLAFDAAGNLYESTLAPAPNAVLRFTPNGQQSTFATTAVRPIFLAILDNKQPDLSVTTAPAWNATQGGVDFGYTVSGSDLPHPPTVALYWASGTGFGTIIGNPIATPTASKTANGSSESFHVTPAQLGTPPQGAKYLLAIVNPPGVNHIPESDDPNDTNDVGSWKSDLSGLAWLEAAGVSQADGQGTYPNSTKVSDLDPSFRTKVQSFIDALTQAGATISIQSTLRSKERAYLMHYAWGIAHGTIAPSSVPSMYGIAIRWDYGDDTASRKAAQEMVSFFGMTNDAVLDSRHIQGLAIDMQVSWSGTLGIKAASGIIVNIATFPRNANNAILARVAATYGVYRLFKDSAPHWV